MSDDKKSVAKGINQFAFELFNEVRKAPGNVLISPFNMSILLIMAWAGSDATTATQIAKTLHLTSVDVDRAVQGMDKLMEYMQSAKNMELFLLNKVYANRAVRIKKPYREMCVTHFKADAEEVDFKVTDVARKTINQWMDKYSKGVFKEVLAANVIKEDTKLLFLNAAYFKAGWSKIFEESSTKKGNFTTEDNKTVEVPMLHGNFQLKYHSLALLSSTGITVPLFDESFEIIFILPSSPDGLATMQEKLGDTDFTDLPSAVMEVYVTVPKFKIEKTTLMKTALTQLGVKDLFQKKANVSNITIEAICAQDFVHKLFFGICEHGTHEGVKSGDPYVAKGMCEPVEFTADRPFVFVVKREADILFVGRVSNPKA